MLLTVITSISNLPDFPTPEVMHAAHCDYLLLLCQTFRTVHHAYTPWVWASCCGVGDAASGSSSMGMGSDCSSTARLARRAAAAEEEV